jgi:hypothetical protein
MSWLTFVLTYAALTGFALGMKTHHRTVFLRDLQPGLRVAFQAGAWLLLGLSFFASAHVHGWQIGPVMWLAMLAAGGFALTLLLTYGPRWCWTPLLLLFIASFP